MNEKNQKEHYTELTKQRSHKKELNSLFSWNYQGLDLYKISGYVGGGEYLW